MTPCEKLGYKVGDKFEVVKVADDFGHGYVLGDKIELIRYDNSDAPEFTDNEGMEQYVSLSSVKKITDSEGWIEWKGGECPVAKGTLVDVKYRNGHQELSIEALFLDRDTSKDRRFGAGHAYWLHDGEINDIIAYRLSNGDSCNCDGCTDGDDSDQDEDIAEQVDWSLDIITLISSVAPNVSVSDALEIASTLQEYGFKK